MSAKRILILTAANTQAEPQIQICGCIILKQKNKEL